MSRALKVVANLIASLIVIGGAIWLMLNRENILDWYYLRDYKPSAQIEELATKATLTEEGRKLFYRADPKIESDRQSLARDCQIKDERTIELGCFLSSNKIYLLDIQQPELQSEMVVTTAHETLHAAYERLSNEERKQLNSQLRQAAKGLNNTKLQERLSDYGQLDAGEEDNELHSILGSEFANLPPELEKHYARYIANRAQVVAYSDQFNQTFDGLREQIRQLEERIQATKTRMEGYRARGQISAYNSLVPVVNADISTYNAKVEQYNRYASVLLGNEPVTATQ